MVILLIYVNWYALSVNRRLSKSSTDLRTNNNVHRQIPPLGPSTSAPSNHLNNLIHNSQRRRTTSEESFNPRHESVYNWRFRDDVVNEGSSGLGASYSNGLNNSSMPAKYCHRVEYLPCDGICAEENFVVEDTQPDSGRSGSSCRTSRGCNTEETRILQDPVKSFELGKQFEKERGDATTSMENLTTIQRTRMPKSRSVFTLPSQENVDARKSQSGDYFQSSNARVRNDLDSQFNMMKVSTTAPQKMDCSRIKTSLSNSSPKSVKPPYMNGNGGAGDLPHTLGTVPK